MTPLRVTVPAELLALLDDAFNRDELMAAFVAEPSHWHLAIRIELPGIGSEGFLFDREAAAWLTEQREDLLQALANTPRMLAFAHVAEWRRGLRQVPLPLRVVDEFEQLLRPERVDRHVLTLTPLARLRSTASPPFHSPGRRKRV